MDGSERFRENRCSPKEPNLKRMVTEGSSTDCSLRALCWEGGEKMLQDSATKIGARNDRAVEVQPLHLNNPVAPYRERSIHTTAAI